MKKTQCREPDLTRVYIALGSNIGDGVALLRSALQSIRSLASGDIKGSSLWRSEPVDLPEGSNWFTNAVVSFKTHIAEEELLDRLQTIERDHGRAADHEAGKSRTLDLDIISYGDKILSTPALQLPHPRASSRLFVLLPLAEIAPDNRFPGSTIDLTTLLRHAPLMRVEKLPEVLSYNNLES